MTPESMFFVNMLKLETDEASKSISNLIKLINQKRSQVQKQYDQKGYFENMGTKQLRQVEEAAMKIAHNSNEDWNDRQKAGRLATSFGNWIDTL